MNQLQQMTLAEWRAEGARRFGDRIGNWKFVCPSCGHIASVNDYVDAKANDGAIGFSCIGRFLPPGSARQAFGPLGGGPCNYAGGGLLAINPIRVLTEDGETQRMFAFADVAPAVEQAERDLAALQSTTPRSTT